MVCKQNWIESSNLSVCGRTLLLTLSVRWWILLLSAWLKCWLGFCRMTLNKHNRNRLEFSLPLHGKDVVTLWQLREVLETFVGVSCSLTLLNCTNCSDMQKCRGMSSPPFLTRWRLSSCETTTKGHNKWHHLRRFIRFRAAAPSGAMKGFMKLFTYADV